MSVLSWPGVQVVYMGEKQVWPPLPAPIPEGAMRVAPGSDAVVWRIQPDYSGEL